MDPAGELAFLAAMAIGAGIGIAVDPVVQYIESDAEGVIDFLANDVDTRRLVLSGLAGGISGGVGNAALQAGARGVVAFGLAVATDTLIDTALERSRDDETGEMAFREVVRTFQNADKEVLEIEIESAAGVVETLGVTTEHPFWVIGEGWVAAQDLEPGDQLFTARSETVWVRRKTRAPDRQTVYIFEVAEYHTYFVGQSLTWAHNSCFTTSGEQLELPFDPPGTRRNVSGQLIDQQGRFVTDPNLPPRPVSTAPTSTTTTAVGVQNNVKGAVFENILESAAARQGRTTFFRPKRRGGLDLVLLDKGKVIVQEAKFVNNLQFDDFTAITTNLKSNIGEVIDNLDDVDDVNSLTRGEMDLVRSTLEDFLAGKTPSNLLIEVVTGKGAPGSRLQNRLRQSVDGLTIDFVGFP